MAEISTAAYADLREYIHSNWQFIELQNETGTKIIRLSPSDSRVTSIIEGNNIKITVVIKGSDIDITKPSTFAKSVVYKVATGGVSYSTESFTPFTIEGEQDELTVIHTIEVPKL